MSCPTCGGPYYYTVEDLDEAVLRSAGANSWNPSSGGWDNLTYGGSVELPAIGTVERIEYHNEEYETQCYLIVSVISAEGNVRTFKRKGWRASHDGSYLDGPTVEVKRETKIVTVTTYEAV